MCCRTGLNRMITRLTKLLAHTAVSPLGVGCLTIVFAGFGGTSASMAQTSPNIPGAEYVFTIGGKLKRIGRPSRTRNTQPKPAPVESATPPIPIRRSVAIRLPDDGTPLPLRKPPAAKSASGAKSTAANTSLPSKDSPSAAGQPETAPVKDVWSPKAIATANARCDRILREVNAIAKRLPPVKRGPCGDPAPVLLSGLAGPMPVTFSPPARVNCALVGALSRWLDTGLQPSAKRYLGARITQVSVMSGYSCRNTYGRKDTKLSQHALANALDIGGFVTSDGRRTRLLKHWGLTRRDIAARAKALAERGEARLAKARAERAAEAEREARIANERSERKRKAAGKAAKAAPRAKVAEPSTRRGRAVENQRVADLAASMRTDTPQNAEPKRERKSERQGLPALPKQKPQRLGGPKPRPLSARPSRTTKKPSKTPSKKAPRQAALPRGKTGAQPSEFDPKRMRFLRDAQRTACKIFGTVLGPEANEAHRNHFHVDLAPRRYGNYCR